MLLFPHYQHEQSMGEKMAAIHVKKKPSWLHRFKQKGSVGVKWPITKIDGCVLFKQGEHICPTEAQTVRAQHTTKVEEVGILLNWPKAGLTKLHCMLSGLLTQRAHTELRVLVIVFQGFIINCRIILWEFLYRRPQNTTTCTNTRKVAQWT